MNAKRVCPAGVVIFYLWKNKFLLILRDDKPDILFPNKWAPVTGGIEEGEKVCGCAERESVEEIGIIPKNLKILGISAKGNGFFFGKLSDHERWSIVLGEGQMYDFFTLEELFEIETGGAFEKYLKKFPDVFIKMSKGYEPTGKDFSLAVWNN